MGRVPFQRINSLEQVLKFEWSHTTCYTRAVKGAIIVPAFNEEKIVV